MSSRRSRPGSKGRSGTIGRGTDALGDLLHLRVRRSASPPPDSPTGPGVESWQDRGGRLAGYGHAEHGWLHLPGVGTFSFRPDGIELCADTEVSEDAIHDAHLRLALPLVLAASGYQVLHGSAVLLPAGAVALCARSGVGKSTLAYGFSRRGAAPCADDAVALTVSGAERCMQSLPFGLRLRPESRAHFGLNGELVASGDELGRTLPLAALCVLERAPAPAPKITRLAPAEAFPAVLAHAYSFGVADPARRRAMVERYLGLASGVPVFRVEVPDRLEAVEATVDAIERAIAGS